MLKVLVNYNHIPDYLEDDDFLIYDRSASDIYLDGWPKEKIIKHDNIGHVDYSKLTYLIDYYDTLPDIFLWSKSNLVPRHLTKEEYEKFKDAKDFTPLLTLTHKTYSDKYGPVCYYDKGMYYERNDSWYLYCNLPNQTEPPKFQTWEQWSQEFQLPNSWYIPFVPGGNYILTRERVHRYSVDFYKKMRSMLDYTEVPGESQLCERSYFLMWK